MVIILDSMDNIIGGDLYEHLISMNIFTLIMNKILNTSSENYEESGYNLTSDLLTILYDGKQTIPDKLSNLACHGLGVIRGRENSHVQS